jgi:hypothetical protein
MHRCDEVEHLGLNLIGGGGVSSLIQYVLTLQGLRLGGNLSLVGLRNMKCGVQFEHELSICSGREEIHGKPSSSNLARWNYI